MRDEKKTGEAVFADKKEIPFNLPAITGREMEYVARAVERVKLSGDGPFNRGCMEWLEQNLGCGKAFLTPSGTHALEMAALLAGIGEGDEVIMPSYTFSSTANAFALRGARIVFMDVRPDTMNMDENLLEEAITEKTKALVPVHYAGVACEMDRVLALAERYGLTVIEDAAQGLGAFYRGEPLGTLGKLGCFSFHETKNITCGEGGALLVNDPGWVEEAEILREKGTDRSRFFRGEIDKYTWVGVGSSYLLGELSAAFLLAQLEQAEEITIDRLRTWNLYYETLKKLQEQGKLELPWVPEGCRHNGHIFYIKTAGKAERSRLMSFLKDRGVTGVFHYVPLHSSAAGRRCGRFHGEDRYTTVESERLLRLPIFYGMEEDKVQYVSKLINEFYDN